MAVIARDFLAMLSLGGPEPLPAAATPVEVANGGGHTTWQDGLLQVWVRPREAAGDVRLASAGWTVLLGDDAEWDEGRPETALVGATTIRYDATSRALTIRTSIVGLPPVFVYRDARRVVIASDLYLMARVAGVPLDLDPVAVHQLGHIGHPVEHRTLFRRTRLLPGASAVTLLADGTERTESSWQLPPSTPASWEDFTDAQIASFEDAVRRMTVSGRFLSLTAGLDTRAVFTTLAGQGRLVPAVTMTGARRSLDARAAARLCAAYGVRHELVTFDDRFTRGLPGFVEQASRLSGGLSSLGQAPEVFLYDQLGGAFAGRISGNLGNQVGRGGTEGVGLRRAGVGRVAPALVDAAGAAADAHWLLAKLDADAHHALGVILHEEIPFSSVGNFSVGHHFVTQQSPYADRALIETLALKPADARSAPSGSVVNMRLRDLRHRFLGEPAHTSFQRRLIGQQGGFAARFPINLGWRASGGVSPVGLALGAATMLGMVAQKTGLDEGPIGNLVSRTGIPALHNFRQATRWLRRHLESFTRDTLGARSIRESGLFDPDGLQRVVDEHFAGTADHFETVTFALDVALAHQLFCQGGHHHRLPSPPPLAVR